MSTSTVSITTNPFLIIAGSITFMVGYAWSDAIQGMIKYYYPVDGTGKMYVRFIYAAIITLIVVFLAYMLKYLYVQSDLITAKVVNTVEPDINKIVSQKIIKHQ